MSERIPESIPTSRSNISNRPTKRRALSPTSAARATASKEITALFANPDREIKILSSDNSKDNLRNAPPEIVANVQGSSAGAGSGEFHVYKASRRREYERLRVMDEEVAKEEQERDFEARRAEIRRAEEEKLGKNRARREKAKMRKVKGKAGGGAGEEAQRVGTGSGVIKSKAPPVKPPVLGGREDDDADADAQADAQQHTEEVGIVIHDDDD